MAEHANGYLTSHTRVSQGAQGRHLRKIWRRSGTGARECSTAVRCMPQTEQSVSLSAFVLAKPAPGQTTHRDVSGACKEVAPPRGSAANLALADQLTS